MVAREWNEVRDKLVKVSVELAGEVREMRFAGLKSEPEVALTFSMTLGSRSTLTARGTKLPPLPSPRRVKNALQSPVAPVLGRSGR
ncbi:MAG: hypothetical protein RIS79_3724 [Verrucomicrobiota bacterium]